MRETSFIKQNKQKWVEFEQNLNHESTDPDKLNDLFIQITDDLSYSRTFYPNRSVRVYLNNLAQQIFYSIYKTKKSRLGRFVGFWKEELPRLVYEAKNEFRLSLFVFTLAFLIGALSSAIDPEFPRVILGDDYVDMTIENIESGDPMAVYKQRGEFGMSLGITANNLFVASLTFVLGVFFAIGTLSIMVSNGVMVGAFQYFFYEQGVFWESFLTIWTHGTLEISAIIIAGAAGLTMGKGLVFPGTYSRLQAFQLSARRGIKIMVGIAPIIIMAGFIEGFLTRYTETPDFIRLLFILLCLAFILGYFWLYPRQLAREGKFKKKEKETRLPPDANQQLRFDRIKSSGEIFSDIFVFYRKYLVKIGLLSLFCASLFCGVIFFGSTGNPNQLFVYDSQFFWIFASIDQVSQYFSNHLIPLLPFVNVLIYGLITFVISTFLVKEEAIKNATLVEKTPTQYLANFIQSLLVAAVTVLPFYFMPAVSLLWIFVIPLLLVWVYIIQREQINFVSGIGRVFSLMKMSIGRIIGLFFLLLIIGALFYSFIDSSLLWFYIEVISWNLSLEQQTLDQLVVVLLTFSGATVLFLIFSMMMIGMGLLYYTLLEVAEAPSLKKRIKYIGTGRRIQGLERET